MDAVYVHAEFRAHVQWTAWKDWQMKTHVCMWAADQKVGKYK